AEEGKAGASTSKPSKRQPTRITHRPPHRRGGAEHEIGGIYGKMLAEALAEEQAATANPRPSKRQKTSEEPSSKIELDVDLFGGPVDVGSPVPTKPDPPHLQQVTLTEFDTATESDVEFEDVDL